jgi:hypothetical protein
MTSRPSRLSAEQDLQPERARLLREVTEQGYSKVTGGACRPAWTALLRSSRRLCGISAMNAAYTAPVGLFSSLDLALS